MSCRQIVWLLGVQREARLAAHIFVERWVGENGLVGQGLAWRAPLLPHRPLLAVIAPPLERFVPTLIAAHVNPKLLQNTNLDVQFQRTSSTAHLAS
jgi:hypothetical protein